MESTLTKSVSCSDTLLKDHNYVNIEYDCDDQYDHLEERVHGLEIKVERLENEFSIKLYDLKSETNEITVPESISCDNAVGPIGNIPPAVEFVGSVLNVSTPLPVPPNVIPVSFVPNLEGIPPAIIVSNVKTNDVECKDLDDLPKLEELPSSKEILTNKLIHLEFDQTTVQKTPNESEYQNKEERVYPIIDTKSDNKNLVFVSICNNCNSKEFLFHVCNGTQVCANCGKDDRKLILGNYKKAKNPPKCEKCNEILFGSKIKSYTITQNCVFKLIILGGIILSIGCRIGWDLGYEKGNNKGYSSGYDTGYSSGYDTGYGKGKRHGCDSNSTYISNYYGRKYSGSGRC